VRRAAGYGIGKCAASRPGTGCGGATARSPGTPCWGRSIGGLPASTSSTLGAGDAERAAAAPTAYLAPRAQQQPRRPARVHPRALQQSQRRPSSPLARQQPRRASPCFSVSCSPLAAAGVERPPPSSTRCLVSGPGGFTEEGQRTFLLPRFCHSLNEIFGLGILDMTSHWLLIQLSLSVDNLFCSLVEKQLILLA